MNWKAAETQLKHVAECARQSGIGKAMFLGYGTLLGVIRDGYFIQHDDDTDICILADSISKQQEDAFYAALLGHNLFEARKREARRDDTGRLLWLSLKEDVEGVKSCIWFQYAWNGMMWHSKGDLWIDKVGKKAGILQANETPTAVAKGIPAPYFMELITVENLGGTYQIPAMYGSCLDVWYPNWNIPHIGGSSAVSYYCVMGKWGDQNSWRMVAKEQGR